MLFHGICTYQILVKLQYKLLDDQRIKINIDRGLGHPLFHVFKRGKCILSAEIISALIK